MALFSCGFSFLYNKIKPDGKKKKETLNALHVSKIVKSKIRCKLIVLISNNEWLISVCCLGRNIKDDNKRIKKRI